jgi:hypothetical protein
MGTFLHFMVIMLDLELGPSPPCSVHAAVIQCVSGGVVARFAIPVFWQ